MLFRIGVLLFALGLGQGSYAQDTIRVLISKNMKRVQLSGFGLRFPQLTQNNDESILPIKKSYDIFFEKNKWTIKTINKTYQLIERQIKIEGNLIKVNGEMAADNLSLLAHDQRIAMVAHLSLDDYLKGVVPSEMPVKWPIEALKAQVITARSYAMYMMMMNAQKDYDLDDTTLHQVYMIHNYKNASFSQKEKIEKAIVDTHGVYLTTAKGTPYLSYYHSDCGGVTEEPRFVWGVKTKYGTVKDEGCKLNMSNKWQQDISIENFALFLKKYLKLEEVPRVNDVQVATYTGSGRVGELKFSYNDNANVAHEAKIAAEQIRKAFGYSKVKSTMFQITRNDDSISFVGRGFGHGVGMCQNGARIMALAGVNFEKIVRRYYPNAHLSTELLAFKPHVE